MKNLVVVRHDCLPSSASVDGSSIVAADVAQGVVYMAMAQPSLAVICISTETPQVGVIWMKYLIDYRYKGWKCKLYRGWVDLSLD